MHWLVFREVRASWMHLTLKLT